MNTQSPVVSLCLLSWYSSSPEPELTQKTGKRTDGCARKCEAVWPAENRFPEDKAVQTLQMMLACKGHGQRKQLGRCPVNHVKTSHSSWTPPLSYATNCFSAFSVAYPTRQEIVAIARYAIPHCKRFSLLKAYLIMQFMTIWWKQYIP